MQLTKRDIEVIQFIDLYGYVQARHICQRFQISQRVAYRRLNLLGKEGYIETYRPFFREHGIYRPSSKGMSIINGYKPREIAMGTYHHDIEVIDISLALIERNPGAIWISERQMKKEKGFQPGRPGHMLDGILCLPSNNKIGIEFEQTDKGKRIEKILAEIYYSLKLGMNLSGTYYLVPVDKLNLAKKLKNYTDLYNDFFRLYLWPTLDEITSIQDKKTSETKINLSALRSGQWGRENA